MAKTIQRMVPAEDRLEVPEDLWARHWLTERFKQSFSRRWRCDLSTISEAEMLDSIQMLPVPELPSLGRLRPPDRLPLPSLHQ